MGKKKHKHHGEGHHGRDDHGHRHDRDRHGPHGHAAVRFDIPPQVAGLAAAALQQVNTPAFRQLMAGALGAAAQAFDQRRAAAPPAPPPPPAPPAPPPPPGPPVEAYRPAFETPEFRLPPEAAQAIEQAARQAGQVIESAATLAARAVETAAEGLARWAEQQRARAAESDERPHG